MAADDEFAEDPTVPTVEQHIADGKELEIPWKKTNQPIRLGTGLLLSTKDSKSSSLANAFRESSGPLQAIFRRETSVSHQEIVTNSSSATSEHLSVALGVEVDVAGGLIGGSVQGGYNKAVSNNSDSEKVSMHSTYRLGIVTFANPPKFTYDAYTAVPPRHEEPWNRGDFTARYGDYYVGGLVIGADNAVMCSASESASESHVHGFLSVTVKVLAWKKTATKEWGADQETYANSMNLAAFDSLENVLVTPPLQPLKPQLPTPNQMMSMSKEEQEQWVINLQSNTLQWIKFVNNPANRFDREKMSELVQMGASIEQRVMNKFVEHGLVDGSPVSENTCLALCRSGLVVGLLLMPFAKCSDYVTARNRRFAR